jgi:hypothetical protein
MSSGYHYHHLRVGESSESVSISLIDTKGARPYRVDVFSSPSSAEQLHSCNISSSQRKYRAPITSFVPFYTQTTDCKEAIRKIGPICHCGPKSTVSCQHSTSRQCITAFKHPKWSNSGWFDCTLLFPTSIAIYSPIPCDHYGPRSRGTPCARISSRSKRGRLTGLQMS